MQLIASNFGRMKNDPEKQAKLIEEYERLCGVKMGRPGKVPHNAGLSKTQEQIAKEFGCSVDTLRRLKQFNRLPAEIKEAVKEGRFSVTTAVKVLSGNMNGCAG